jgi:hypothetical protein
MVTAACRWTCCRRQSRPIWTSSPAAASAVPALKARRKSHRLPDRRSPPRADMWLGHVLSRFRHPARDASR